MTHISFHHDLPDPQGYLCRLLRQIYRKGDQIAVVGQASVLQQVSAHLWHMGEHEFVAHATPQDPDYVQRQSPVQLCTQLAQAQQHSLALNLCTQVPEDFARFAKIIELVGLEPQLRLAARARLRFYKDHGYEIQYFPYQAS